MGATGSAIGEKKHALADPVAARDRRAGGAPGRASGSRPTGMRSCSEYLPLLAIPNVASNRADIRRNADHIVAMMRRRGLAPRLLESADGTVPPLVYGEWLVPGAARTSDLLRPL